MPKMGSWCPGMPGHQLTDPDPIEFPDLVLHKRSLALRLWKQSLSSIMGAFLLRQRSNSSGTFLSEATRPTIVIIAAHFDTRPTFHQSDTAIRGHGSVLVSGLLRSKAQVEHRSE